MIRIPPPEDIYIDEEEDSVCMDWPSSPGNCFSIEIANGKIFCAGIFNGTPWNWRFENNTQGWIGIAKQLQELKGGGV